MIADFSTTSTYMIGKLEILHVFLFNCISGSTDLNIDRFITFVSHDQSRSQNPALMLKLAYCKTITFQASFFDRIVKPWNTICRLAISDNSSA